MKFVLPISTNCIYNFSHFRKKSARWCHTCIESFMYVPVMCVLMKPNLIRLDRF